MKKFLTPLFLLNGVLIFSMVLAYMDIQLKSLLLGIVLIAFILGRSLDISKLAKICYRFRYLFFSIILLNVLFSPSNLLIALDKALLLFLMLAVVSAYMQVQSTDDIISALNSFLKPLSIFGIDTNKSAQLIGATINSVERLQSMQNNINEPNESKNSEPTSNKNRIKLLINNLANWILEIEKNALKVDTLDSYPRDSVLQKN